jgi:hypothetical protein
MAVVITRSAAALAATTSNQALSNLGASSLSSSFNIPVGMSAIKQISISVTSLGVVDFVPLVTISGNGMKEGAASFAGMGYSAGASSTASSNNNMVYDTDLPITANNSVEIALAVTTAATVDAAITVTFA